MAHSAAPQDLSADGTLHDVSAEAREWFERLRSGRFDDADLRDFIDWHNADPAHAADFSELERQASLSQRAAQASIPPPAFISPESAARPQASARLITRAAVALMLCAVAAGVSIMLDLPKWLAADVVTTTGERRTLPLPDGSKVVLNSQSAMRFDFANARRGIDLQSGEAFVEVRADEAWPFEVTAGRTQVQATDGAFAVRFQSRDVLYVFVANGTAQVASLTAEGVADSLSLEAGDTARVTPSGAESWGRVEGDDLVAWRDGRLVFQNQPIRGVIDELSRHYKGWIVLASDRLHSARISGEYNLDDPDSMIDALAQATGARVTRLTDNLVVLRCQ